MTQVNSDFLKILTERGFFDSCSNVNELDRKLSSQSMTAYTGFDATANSLHIGSLVQIMMMRWFQKTGHTPIILFGGATSMIGDPSGKSKTREMLDDKDIKDNIKGINSVFSNYLDLSKCIQVNNHDWFKDINYIDFLRDIGKHFTINRMLTMRTTETRLCLNQPLNFIEFNYMLLQSYDFLRLNTDYNCEIQFGGSDQWGNIVNGIDLIKKINNTSAYGLTSNLLINSDGMKMGKTEKGAVWLNPDKLSPFMFWQFWRNVDDSDVKKFLKLFTELPLDECERLGRLRREEANEAKIILANEVCKLCHGVVADQNYVVDVKYTNLVKLLQELQFTDSGKQSKRLIKHNGVKINGSHCNDINVNLTGIVKIKANQKEMTIRIT